MFLRTPRTRKTKPDWIIGLGVRIGVSGHPQTRGLSILSLTVMALATLGPAPPTAMPKPEAAVREDREANLSEMNTQENSP